MTSPTFKHRASLAVLLVSALAVPAATLALPTDTPDLNSPPRIDSPSTSSEWEQPASPAPCAISNPDSLRRFSVGSRLWSSDRQTDQSFPLHRRQFRPATIAGARRAAVLAVVGAPAPAAVRPQSPAAAAGATARRSAARAWPIGSRAESPRAGWGSACVRARQVGLPGAGRW